MYNKQSKKRNASFFLCAFTKKTNSILENHSHLKFQYISIIPFVWYYQQYGTVSSHIVCRTLSYNTKDRRPRLDSYNSFHDQPDDNQNRVYVVFVNPSADTGLPFLSRILSQSISCPQGHSFEGILMDMLLQRRQTKRIKYAISIQKKKINTNGNYAICLIYLCTTGSYLTDFKKQNCLTSHQKKS